MRSACQLALARTARILLFLRAMTLFWLEKCDLIIVSTFRFLTQPGIVLDRHEMYKEKKGKGRKPAAAKVQGKAEGTTESSPLLC
jgi:molybdopterin-guanine dinucleotide biosynthesis protein